MKRIPKFIALVAISLGLTASAAFAQVTSYQLTMTQKNNQTDVSTVTTPTKAYEFFAAVNGTNINGLTPVQFTPPAKSPVNLSSGGPNSWMYDTFGPPLFQDLTSAEFTAGYPAGTYAFNIGGTTANLDLTGGFYSNPLVNASTGTWTSSGGPPRVQYDPTQSITFSWLAPSGFVTGDKMTLIFSGPGAPSPFVSTSSSEVSNTYSAGSFQAGSTYTASLEFSKKTDFETVAISGATGVAFINNTTTFSLEAAAVPEPGTYAALIGVAALGFAAWRRRRQA